MNYEIRTSVDPASLVEAVRRQIAALNPEIRIAFARPLEGLIDERTLRDRLVARLALASGALALFITCFGLYAVLSYSVVRRTAEIGVRIALGAEPGRILRAVAGEALVVAAVGLAAGVPLALALSSLVRSRLFGLSAADPLTLVLVSLALIVITAVAAFIPARRAATVDPIRALRCE
jgi:predicted lysophospholipase L1 biosynthesis ABC-type transport system permease subunit